MKSKKFGKKLELNKQTVVNLDKKELGNVMGGDYYHTQYLVMCFSDQEGCTTDCQMTGFTVCCSAIPMLC